MSGSKRQGRRRDTPRRRTTTHPSTVKPAPAWFAAAVDVVSRGRAEPLPMALKNVERARRLGKRERALMRDAIYGKARNQANLDVALDTYYRRVGGRRLRQQDVDTLQLWWTARDLMPEVELADDLLPEPRLILSKHAVERGSPLPPWTRPHLPDEIDIERLDEALRARAPFTIAVDTTTTTAADVLKALQAAEITARPCRWIHDGIVVDGRPRLEQLVPDVARNVRPMDEASMLAAALVANDTDGPVLDMCAGGGGKAWWLRSRGVDVVAMDLSRRRLTAVDGSVRLAADGRRAPFVDGTFGRVLVDAPCSGSGVVRRDPLRLANLDTERLASLAALQVELLLEAIRIVRPGGLVFYATCSLFRDENDAVLDTVIERSDVSAVSMKSIMPSSINAELCDPTVHRLLLDPARHGTDGFFVAALRKS